MSNLQIAAGSYLFFGTATPFLVRWSYFRDSLVPRLSYELGLHQIPSDATVLSVAAIALYTYVLLPIAADLARNCRTGGELEQGISGLQQLFPAFIASSFLTWANTNRFDPLRSGFIILQTLSLFLLPLTHYVGYPTSRSVVNIAYRCVLAWTLFYSIMPRETSYIINHIVHVFDPFYDTYPLAVQKPVFI